MTLPAVFISHCPEDSAYCEALVEELRNAGLDVWYESHGANPPQPPEVIARELGQRSVYLALLSPAMLRWRQGEKDFDWAHQRYWRDPYTYSVMTVVAAPCNEFDLWQPLRAFYRVERAPLQPCPPAEAAWRVRLALAPAGPELLATLLPGNPLPQPSAETHALLAQGYALVSQGQRRAAVEVYRRATEADPQAIAAWNTLGIHLLDTNHDEDARAAFEQALKMDPANMFARTGRANSFAIPQPAKALELTDALLGEWPRNAFALNGRAVALLGLQRADEALAAVGYALALAPTYASAWNNKSVVLGRLKRVEEAFAANQRTLTLDPTRPSAWSNRGTLFNRMSRCQEALANYDYALSLDPTFAAAWRNRATELINLKRYDEALIAFDHALALKPDPALLRRKAVTLLKLGRVLDAARAQREATLMERRMSVGQ